MPIPEPESDEDEQEFISRCAEEMYEDPELDDEFPDRDQKLAVCYSKWERQNESIEERMNCLRERLMEDNIREQSHDLPSSVQSNLEDIATRIASSLPVVTKKPILMALQWILEHPVVMNQIINTFQMVDSKNRGGKR